MDLVEAEEVVIAVASMVVATVVVIAVAAMVEVIAVVATVVVIAVAAMVAVATVVATVVVIAVAAMAMLPLDLIVLSLINLLEQKVGKIEVMEIHLKILNMRVGGAGEKGECRMIAMLQARQIKNPFLQALSLI